MIPRRPATVLNPRVVAADETGMGEEVSRSAERASVEDLAEAAELQRGELRTWTLDEVLSTLGYVDRPENHPENHQPAAAEPPPVAGETGEATRYEPEGDLLHELAELTVEIAAPPAVPETAEGGKPSTWPPTAAGLNAEESSALLHELSALGQEEGPAS